MHYYSEFDPHAARWLRNLMADGLIPQGEVDERDIRDVSATDLRGFTQCHFFAGIAGWSLALRLAGWPEDRPAWTGSCPCQPFSAAGKRQAQADERHLWPAFFRLVRECRPDVCFGEQVEGAIGHGWLDGISADLEGEGYAVGSAVLGAHSVGAPHVRQRLFWVADADGGQRRNGRLQPGREHRQQPEDGGVGDGMGHAEDDRTSNDRETWQPDAKRPSTNRGVGQSRGTGLEERVGDGRVQREAGRPQPGQAAQLPSHWDSYALIPCGDGKTRRVEPGLQPLVDGFPFILVDGRTAPVSRSQVLRGIGNAIVPQVAAAFIRAYRGVGQR